MLPLAATVRLLEGIEDSREHGRVDAIAGVRHRDPGVRVVTDQPHVDAAPLSRELYGVREEVRKDLLKPARVTQHLAGGVCQLDHEAKVLRLDLCGESVDGLPGDEDEIDRLPLDLHPTGDDPGDVDQITDHLSL